MGDIVVKNPISKTVTVASGLYPFTDVFEIPKNKIGKLVKIEGYHLTRDGILRIYDNYEDAVTEVSALTLRKEVSYASGYDKGINVDVKKSIKLLGKIKAYSSASGFTLTLTADLE